MIIAISPADISEDGWEISNVCSNNFHRFGVSEQVAYYPANQLQSRL